MSTRSNSPLSIAWLVMAALGSVAMLFVGLAASTSDVGITLIIGGAVVLAMTFVATMLKCPELAAFALSAVGSGVMLAAGLFTNELPAVGSDGVLVAAGGLGLVVTLCIGLLWSRTPGGTDSKGERWEMLELLQKIHEQSLLSDTARRVIYRERELDLLRKTIEEDIRRGDYNAALVLCDDMEQLFGYTEEADAARERVLQQRNTALSEDIQRHVADVHRLLQSGQWKKAKLSANRLHRLYPDSPQLLELEQNIEGAIEDRKRMLHAQFKDAVDQEDLDRSMETLRELDQYLSSQEAEAIRASAQQVISGHRELLSSRFRDAVSKHDWAEAIRWGEQIMLDYPMDTMAAEVREMMDRLHERAEAIDPTASASTSLPGKGSPG